MACSSRHVFLFLDELKVTLTGIEQKFFCWVMMMMIHMYVKLDVVYACGPNIVGVSHKFLFCVKVGWGGGR